jgi:hypothetical protein
MYNRDIQDAQINKLINNKNQNRSIILYEEKIIFIVFIFIKI